MILNSNELKFKLSNNPFIDGTIRLLKSGNYKDGLNNLNFLIEYFPNEVEPYQLRGYYYQNLENYSQAIIDYEKASELNILKDGYDSIFLIGIKSFIYSKIGMIEKAIESLNYIMREDSKSHFDYTSRAYLKIEKKDFKSALQDFYKAYELDSKNLFQIQFKKLVTLDINSTENLKTVKNILFITPKTDFEFLKRSIAKYHLSDYSSAIQDILKTKLFFHYTECSCSYF